MLCSVSCWQHRSPPVLFCDRRPCDVRLYTIQKGVFHHEYRNRQQAKHQGHHHRCPAGPNQCGHFLRQLRSVRDARYHHSDAGVLCPAGRHRLLHHRHEGEKARCDPHLQHRPGHYGRISAVHRSVHPLRCHRRAAAVEDRLRQCKGADHQLCHQSGAGRIRQHHHSLRHRSQGYGGSDGHRWPSGHHPCRI